MKTCERCGNEFKSCKNVDRRKAVSQNTFKVIVGVPGRRVCPSCLVTLTLKAITDLCRCESAFICE